VTLILPLSLSSSSELIPGFYSTSLKVDSCPLMTVSVFAQNVRREFVTGVLSEEELGNKIFVYELAGEYAARVSNLRAYDAVRKP